MLLFFNLLDYQMWEEQVSVWRNTMDNPPSRTGGRGGPMWPLLAGNALSYLW